MEQLQQRKGRYSVEEYFKLLEQSEEKFEYHGGEVYMMAGGTSNHNIISLNTGRRILEGLDNKDCIGYGSDMKVEIAKNQSYVFPDVLVVCGPIDFAEDRNDTIKNPVLIVEVLSPSTEAYDRGLKFRMYRSLSSLQEYVLISQEEPLVETFYRQNDKSWHYRVAQGMDAKVTLASIEHTINLKDIYQKINLSQM